MSKSEPKPRSHWPITAFNTLGSVSNIAMALLLARILAPAELGVFKVFFLYISICPALFLVCGINHGFSYWSGKSGPGLKCIQMSSLLILGQAIVALLLVLVLGPRVSSGLGWSPDYTLPFAVGVFAVVAANFFEDAVIASGRIWQGAIFSGTMELARTGSMIGAGLLTHRLTPILEAHAIVQVLRVMAGYIYGSRLGLSRWTWDLGSFREILRYAFPVSLSFILGIGMNYSDELLLSRWISPEKFAFYSIGCLTVPPLTILQSSMVSVLVPQLSQAFESGQQSYAAELHRRFTAEAAYFLIPAAVGLLIFASPVIRLLFTDRYASAAEYLRYYSVWYLTLAVAPDVVPRARGEGGWIFGFTAAFSALTIVLCWILASWRAALGALLGLLLARIAARVYGLWYAGTSSKWRWREFMPTAFLLHLSALVALLGVGCVWSERILGNGIRWFFVSGTAFTLLYFIFSWGWRGAELGDEPADRKVLLLSQHLGIGGLERMLLNLAVSLKRSGNWVPEVFVFDHLSGTNSSTDSMVSEFLDRGISVVTFEKPRGFSPVTVWRIVRHAVCNRTRVLHSHDLGALVYAVLAKLCTLGYLRVVHTQHSFVHLHRCPRYRIYERFFTRFTSRLAVVSESTREIYLSLGVPSSRIKVIPNGVPFRRGDSSPLADDHGRKSRARRGILAEHGVLAPVDCEANWILYLARKHPGKGQDRALELWERLSDSTREQSVLLFVGPAQDAEFAAQVNERIATSPNKERLIQVGATRKPEGWLELSDVFVSCSEFEGMPLSPIEALGAGLPVLVSRIPGHSMLREFAVDYPLQDPSAGAAALEAMLGQTRRPEASLARDASLARERFSVETMTERYEELYSCQLS